MITAPDFQKKQIVFVFFNDGEKMSITNDNLIVKDKDGKIKFQCTCYRLFLVYAIGSFSLTSVVVQRAKKFGFFIACMTTGFHLYDIIGAKKEGNTLLHAKQYSYSGIDIGKQILKNKIRNQRYVLMSKRHKSDCELEDIKCIENYCSLLDEACTINELMAYEGLVAKLYFKNHFDKIDWNGRCPRIKSDYVNSTLDIGYSLLFAFLDCIIESYGFDTYVGVLHRQFYLRKSLVCDLIEPIRPLIDCQVEKSINLGQIKKSDFKKINTQWQLKYEFSNKYVKLFMTPVVEEKEKIFAYVQKYYRAFMKGVKAEDFPTFDIGGCL